MSEIKVGVIGCGAWGKNLVRNFYQLGALKAVCDFSEELLEAIKRKFPGLQVTTDYQEILKDGDIKGVVISTPAFTHYDLAQEALQAGKDVFVEKPLALKYSQGEELVSLAKAKKEVLFVGHLLRYHPVVVKLKELINAGYLGKVQYIYSHRLNMGKLRTEENILWSFAPHDISVILHLLGEMPESISAFGEAYLQPAIYDVTLTILDFPSQVKAHIFVSWLHPFKEHRLVVVGSNKMAVFDDTKKHEKLVVYPHSVEWQGGKIPVAQRAEKEAVEVDEEEPLKLECQHFLECLAERQVPRTDGEEGLRVLKVLENAEKALAKTSVRNLYVVSEDYFVHPTCVVDENVEIGKGTKVWHFSHILANTKIGEECVLGQNVMIGPDVQIGNRVKVQNNVSVYKGVTLEDDVFCGPSCVFTNVVNPRSFIERKDEFKETLVKKGATIGANATVVCGVTVGKYALIGAGAVVTKDVADHALVVGVPATQRGWVCRCGETLSFNQKNEAKCACGNEYCLIDNQLEVVKEAD